MKTGYALVTITEMCGEPYDDPGPIAITLARLTRLGMAQARVIKRIPAHGVAITHYYDPKEAPRSAEYVVGGTGRFEVTNHGLGSGIYGFQDPTREKTAEEIRRRGLVGTPIHLNNPFYIQDDLHGAQVTAMSKSLQALAADIVEKSRRAKVKPSDYVVTFFADPGHEADIANVLNRISTVFDAVGRQNVIDKAGLLELFYYYLLYSSFSRTGL
jgi:hypothetical protein